jgi:hypothetical protein
MTVRFNVANQDVLPGGVEMAPGEKRCKYKEAEEMRVARRKG